MARLRSLFSLAQQHRFAGTTRDDFAEKNAPCVRQWTDFHLTRTKWGMDIDDQAGTAERDEGATE